MRKCHRIFRFLNEYFREKDIDCGNCVRVFIDGAASMTAYRFGAVPKTKSSAPKNVAYSLHNPSGAFSCSETAC